MNLLEIGIAIAFLVFMIYCFVWVLFKFRRNIWECFKILGDWKSTNEENGTRREY
jgi:hypothetical protein